MGATMAPGRIGFLAHMNGVGGTNPLWLSLRFLF